MLDRTHAGRLPLVAFALSIIAVAVSCRGGEKMPDKSSPEYRNTVRAFYVGLAALEAGEDSRAETRLTEATQLAPGEPAAWANLGLLSLRQREFDRAAERLAKARSLAPDDSRILVLQAALESNRGNFDEAVKHLRRAVEVNAADLRALYTLAEQVERQGTPESEAEAQQLMEKILAAQPDNLAVLLELTRLAAKRGDTAALQKSVERISAKAAAWPPEIREQLAALQAAASGADTRAAGTRVAFLRNALVRVPEYRQSLAAVKLPTGEISEPFTRFLKLPSPSPDPAPPDDALGFAAEPLATSDKSSWAGAISLDGEGAPTVFSVSGQQVTFATGASLPFPGGNAPPAVSGVLGIDFNYDFKTDLVFAAAGGVRLFQQNGPAAFADVTARAGLPATITGAAFAGAWAADVEADGDLDIVLGAQGGPPVVLRNNGDGTFKNISPFQGVSALRAFAWGDLDADGDADAVLLDAEGRLHFFTNERGGEYRERAVPEGIGSIAAMTIADVNSDGLLDLLALRPDGAILRMSDKNEGTDWEAAELASSFSSSPDASNSLLAADLDNNGSLDLVVNGQVLLSDAQGKFKSISSPPNARVYSTADLNGDGRLDLVGVASDGKAIRLLNRGAKNYHWQTLRPRAATATGDQRINSFGVGGEMEIRSGLLFQKQPIAGPLVHFGLGEQAETEVVRIVWPNGYVQAEFELQPDQTVLAEQRLKGSCPSLFAFDGKQMSFVKDCAPWSPAIGLRINLNQTASITQTEEWVKIRGDQLAPRDGFYDLRVTAELWESYYIDRYKLMVVDHPAGTAVFVDERTANPPPALKVYTVAEPRPIARAWDDGGRDVTQVVRDLDNRYLDNFARGQYQGLTRDHFVEVELDETVQTGGPLWLVAHGWLHPTDATVNIAISQNGGPPPRPLSLEVADPRGGWRVVRPSLGFPAGKNKIILIDLSGVFIEGAPRRFRLRTNMEIFWDKLEVAAGVSEAQTKTELLGAETAELRYRGFSEMRRADQSSPDLPDYNRLAATAPIWRDLAGYYTRLGDIRELVAETDDRIVIVNAGDEMAFRFRAPAPPAAGYARDFVFIGNGWIKDGDLNSVFSKTVLPLPMRGMTDYTTPPGRLEDDPAYRRHASDWQDYHTRYVTPQRFQDTLKLR